MKALGIVGARIGGGFDDGAALNREMNDGAVGGHEDAVCIYQFGGEVTQVGGTGTEDGTVGGQADAGGLAGGAQGEGIEHFVTRFAIGGEGARCIGKGEGGDALSGGRYALGADGGAVEPEGNGGMAGVDVDGYLFAFAAGKGVSGRFIGPAPGAEYFLMPFRDGCVDKHFEIAAVPDDIAVVRLRLFAAGEVEIAAPGIEPGKGFGEGGILIESGVGDAGFAQIIEGGPYKVADDVGMGFCPLPVVPRFGRE